MPEMMDPRRRHRPRRTYCFRGDRWIDHIDDYTDPRQILGENVHRERVLQRMTKASLCQLAGISRPLLDTIESGRSNLTLKRVVALAEAFGIEPWQLLQPRDQRSWEPPRDSDEQDKSSRP